MDTVRPSAMARNVGRAIVCFPAFRASVTFDAGAGIVSEKHRRVRGERLTGYFDGSLMPSCWKMLESIRDNEKIYPKIVKRRSVQN
jgi:hypothetical protein